MSASDCKPKWRATAIIEEDSELEIHSSARVEELLISILLEMKIANKYNSIGYDMEITDNDIEE